MAHIESFFHRIRARRVTDQDRFNSASRGVRKERRASRPVCPRDPRPRRPPLRLPVFEATLRCKGRERRAHHRSAVDVHFIEDYRTGRCDFPRGSAAELYTSVHERLYALPDATRVFVGHDYQPGGRPLRYEPAPHANGLRYLRVPLNMKTATDGDDDGAPVAR